MKIKKLKVFESQKSSGFLKKLFVYSLFLIVFSMFVNAANVGVIVSLADGSFYEDCVYVADASSAYDAFQKTSLNIVWQNFGFGYFIESVEGVASDDTPNFYWSFWHVNSAADDFEAAVVGASDYIVSNETVIGLSYTDFDLSFNPKIKPVFKVYEDICPNLMSTNKEKAIVDGDSESIDNGDEIKVRPGSELVIRFELENEDEDNDLDDIEIEAILERIDDGDDLEEEDDFDLRDGDEEEVEFTFDIPIDAREDEYDLTINISGQGKVPYNLFYEYVVDLKRRDDDLNVNVPKKIHLDCGSTRTFEVDLSNIGEDEQDVDLRVSNIDLGIDLFRTFELDDGDSDSKSFTITIPEDAKGEYNLKTNVYYSSKSDEYYTVLSISCYEKSVVKKTSTESSVKTSDSDDEIVVLKEAKKISANVVKQQEEVDLEKNPELLYVVLLILGNLGLISLLIFIIKR